MLLLSKNQINFLNEFVPILKKFLKDNKTSWDEFEAEYYCNEELYADITYSLLRYYISKERIPILISEVFNWQASNKGFNFWRKLSKKWFKLYDMHNTLKNIISRCTNPKNKDYKYYGAKGITIFPAWSDEGGIIFFTSYVSRLPNFHLKNKFKLTLDRIDPNFGYVPGNLRWANKKTQMHNRCNKGKNYEK